jgi:hypothetical protein
LGYNISAQRGERAIVEGQGPDNNRTQVSTNNWAAFAQDSWEVTSGLTLNLGVRWDRASIWNANGVAGRAGFAWDIKQNQRTILRGGYGRFYDVSLLEVAQDIVELGGIQRAVQDTQTIPRGASFYNNPAIGAFGPLQFSSSRWLQNPTLFEHILPEGTELSSAGTFQIQRDGKIEVDSTIVGKGNPYIMYDLLGIKVDDPSLPPVLSYESIPVLTGGRFTPEEAAALLNEFFPHPSGAGSQFDFLEQQGPGSVYDERVLIYNFRQLDLIVDRRQVFSTDNTLPYTDAFNFGIDQAISGDFTIDAEFHIRRSRNLLTRRVSNLLPVPIAGSCFENTVDGPTACLLGIENLGFLDTNAFTVALKKRFSRKHSFLGSYTFTDAFDNFSTLRVPPRGAEISFLFNNMPELDEGRSLNTPRHVFVFSGLYRLPLGFDLSGVVGAQSGRPFNANGLPFDSDGDDIFDNRLIGTEKGEFSTANYFNIDLRIAKVFQAGERSAVTLLIEFFNLTNRANPFIVSQVCQDSTGDGLPDLGGCGGPGFGGNVEPLPGREVQIGVKVDF